MGLGGIGLKLLRIDTTLVSPTSQAASALRVEVMIAELL